MTAAAKPAAKPPGKHAPVTYEQWRANRRAAMLWAVKVPALIATFTFITFSVTRAPAGMGMFWPPAGESGLTAWELVAIVGLSCVLLAALTLVQDLLMRPLLADDKQKGEKVFFISSLAARVVFIATLVYYHYGPGWEDLSAYGESNHKFGLMAVFYASYWSDLIQMWRRPQEFAKSFRNFMVPHHLLSFTWFTPWLLFGAPRGVQGMPIWNTVFIYLCAAVPNHTYKLLACWYRPHWYSLLLGPAVYAHWAILLASQDYYFKQCACSAWGCWYPSTCFMLFGAWGMAIGDVPNFLDSIIYSSSKVFGANVGLWRIVPILRKSPPPRVAAEGPARAAPVTVELVLRPMRGGKAAKRSGAGAAAAGGLRSRVRAALVNLGL